MVEFDSCPFEDGVLLEPVFVEQPLLEPLDFRPSIRPITNSEDQTSQSATTPRVKLRLIVKGSGKVVARPGDVCGIADLQELVDEASANALSFETRLHEHLQLRGEPTAAHQPDVVNGQGVADNLLGETVSRGSCPALNGNDERQPVCLAVFDPLADVACFKGPEIGAQ